MMERLHEESYQTLHALLDDVLVLSQWVMRQSLRWVPEAPRKEALELGWLELHLEQLENATALARAKVAFRREMAERAEGL